MIVFKFLLFERISHWSLPSLLVSFLTGAKAGRINHARTRYRSAASICGTYNSCFGDQSL